MEHDIRTNRVSGQRAEPATSATMVQMIHCCLSNRQSGSYCGGSTSQAKRDVIVISLTATTTQRLYLLLLTISFPSFVLSSSSLCLIRRVSCINFLMLRRGVVSDTGWANLVATIRSRLFAPSLLRVRGEAGGTRDGRLHSQWWLASGPLRSTRRQPTGFAGRTTEGNRHGPYRWPFFVVSGSRFSRASQG